VRVASRHWRTPPFSPAVERPVVNLGFSGDGRMDAGVGEYLAKIDARAYLIDCLPNMGPAEDAREMPAAREDLRAAAPKCRSSSWKTG